MVYHGESSLAELLLSAIYFLRFHHKEIWNLCEFSIFHSY